MRAVVTGAGGFLGRLLVPRLCEAGFDVVAVSSKSEADLLTLMPSLQFGSVRVVGNRELLGAPQFLEDAVVISCAFPRASDGAGMARGLDFIDALFAAAATSRARGVINVSSQSVYSDTRERAAIETDPLDLNTPYAVAKYVSELLLEARCAGRVPFTSIRLASLIGRGFSQRVINRMIDVGVEDGVIRVTSGGIFDFMDGRDAASALVSVARSDSSKWFSIYNLGAEHALPLAAIAKTAVDVLEARGVACELAFDEDVKDGRSSALNSGLFRADFCWEPTISLRETAASIADDVLATKLRTRADGGER